MDKRTGKKIKVKAPAKAAGALSTAPVTELTTLKKQPKQ